MRGSTRIGLSTGVDKQGRAMISKDWRDNKRELEKNRYRLQTQTKYRNTAFLSSSAACICMRLHGCKCASAHLFTTQSLRVRLTSKSNQN